MISSMCIEVGGGGYTTEDCYRGIMNRVHRPGNKGYANIMQKKKKDSVKRLTVHVYIQKVNYSVKWNAALCL